MSLYCFTEWILYPLSFFPLPCILKMYSVASPQPRTLSLSFICPLFDGAIQKRVERNFPWVRFPPRHARVTALIPGLLPLPHLCGFSQVPSLCLVLPHTIVRSRCESKERVDDLACPHAASGQGQLTVQVSTCPAPHC